jgi:hypothetical protein
MLKGDPSDANYTFNVYPYFTSTCFRGFGDDEKVTKYNSN